jgi:hypothetical protein
LMRACDVCQAPYEALRRTSKSCSKRCSMRTSRAGVTAGSWVAREPSADGLALVEVARRELEAAGREQTALGQLAVLLAGRLCGPLETGGGVAALSKELREVMAVAVASAVAGADPLDELRRRREAKLGRA